MDTDQALQNQFLKILRSNETKVSVYLKNGTRLEGYIHSFDRNTVLLNSVQPFLIFKQCICSILPTENHEIKNH